MSSFTRPLLGHQSCTDYILYHPSIDYSGIRTLPLAEQSNIQSAVIPGLPVNTVKYRQSSTNFVLFCHFQLRQNLQLCIQKVNWHTSMFCSTILQRAITFDFLFASLEAETLSTQSEILKEKCSLRSKFFLLGRFFFHFRIKHNRKGGKIGNGKLLPLTIYQFISR